MPRASSARPATGSAASGREPTTRTGGVRSMRRGLKLLELLSDGEGPWSLADLSRDLDVNKAIALRLLDELRAAGFVYRDEHTGAYELTYKLSNLGLRKLAQTRLLDQSSGVLRELANATGELVRLAVVEPGDRLTWVLAFVGARRTLHIDPNYRLKIGFNTHAAGKAWLSTLPPERAWQIVGQTGIEKLTVYSKTERKDIEADWKRTRLRKYAVSSEENELGVRAIAAPIMVDLTAGVRACVGVVSVAAPTSRMSRREIEACAPELLDAVVKLSDIWPIGGRTVKVLPSIL